MKSVVGVLSVLFFLSAGCTHPPQTWASPEGSLVVPKFDGPVPWTSLNIARTPGEFRFAVVSDRNGGCRGGVFESAIAKLNLLQPEFVLCIGDLIAGYSTDRAKLQGMYQEMDHILTPLEAPFFRTVGNHDISNPVAAEAYRQRYGRLYYHFVYENVLFLILCTEEPGNFSQEQVAYARRALQENAGVRWTFVLMHQPLFKDKASAWSKIAPSLHGRPYTVLAGHDHIYCQHVIDGQEYLVLSTTGGGSPLRGPGYGEFDHLVWVTMTDKGPRLANLMLDGIQTTAIHTSRDVSLAAGVTLDAEPIYTDGDFSGGATEIRIANATDQSVSVHGAFEANAMLVPTPNGFDARVAPRSVKRVPVRIEAARPCPPECFSPLHLTAILQAQGLTKPMRLDEGVAIAPARRFDCPPAPGKIVVDGRLDEWGTLPFEMTHPAQILHDPAVYAGPESCRFRFATAYDKDYLYVAIRVTDNKLFLPLDRPVWEQDGLEVRLCALAQPALARHHGEGDNRDVTVVMVSPGASPDKPYIWPYGPLPKGAKIACVKTAEGYNAEIAIPASYLDQKQAQEPLWPVGGRLARAAGIAQTAPAAGKVAPARPWKEFRLNIAVDNFDKAGRGTQLWWVPDWRTPQTYPGSGTFVRK